MTNANKLIICQPIQTPTDTQTLYEILLVDYRSVTDNRSAIYIGSDDDIELIYRRLIQWLASSEKPVDRQSVYNALQANLVGSIYVSNSLTNDTMRQEFENRLKAAGMNMTNYKSNNTFELPVNPSWYGVKP